MYFVSKSLAEQAAWKFAKENNLDFITIIPPLVVGSFLMPSMPPSLITSLSPITGTCCHALVIIEHVVQFTCPSKFTLTCSIAGNEAHYSILKQTQFVHLDDLCNAHIFLYEHPKAEGRYICSGCDATIHDVAKLLREKFPEYNVPTKWALSTSRHFAFVLLFFSFSPTRWYLFNF